MQNLLFQLPEISSSPIFPEIPGLYACENFINPEEETLLMRFADTSPWLNDLRRRVQHFGYRYDYTLENDLKPTTAMPIWARELSEKISTWLFKTCEKKPHFEQMIVNEYLPGQGISAHIDRTEHFGEPLAVLSLGSDTGYRFVLPGSSKSFIDFILPCCSLVVMTGDARYRWMHEMPARKSDINNGVRVWRGRRISMTFRTVL